MKKTTITLLLSFIFMFSFSQTKWQPHLGIEGGTGPSALTSEVKPDHSNGWSSTIGASIQLMRSISKPYGFEVKANYNWIKVEGNKMFKYISVPLLLRICLSSKTGYTRSSWSDESYSYYGNSLYHTPSQYSEGGTKVTSTVFFYAGAQYDMLQKALTGVTGPGVTATAVTDITGNYMNSGYSIVAGLELNMGKIYFDFSYQKGMSSIDPNIENNINTFWIKIKFLIF